MENQTFKAGDVVRLKSGGPDMTIQFIENDTLRNNKTIVYCSWFEGIKPFKGDFTTESLILAPAKSATGGFVFTTL